VRRYGVAFVALIGLMSPLTGHAERGLGNSADASTVTRFLTRPDEPVQSYRALRRLEASNPRFDLHGWIEAWTEVTPTGQFTYEVVREGGSDYIRKKVLRPLLENEEKLVATRNISRAAVNEANYELRGAEAAEPGLVKLRVKPRREDVLLVDGAVFVTEDDADLVRVEGRLAKNPSFWTRRVDVVRSYERIAGMRVPVRLDSTAQIRFAGTATLSVTWDYQTINGMPVSTASALVLSAR
jgi:hypothetical protein